MTEDVFFSELFERLPPTPDQVVIPPGDDCAGLRFGEDQILLLAVDQVVGGCHYEVGDAAVTPEAVGRKLLARNLSDIAAMGGTPRYCLVSLAAPPARGSTWLRGVLDGVASMAAEWSMHMIGGDVASTPNDEVGSLTVVGMVEPAKVCMRRGAGPGDCMVATGRFGDAVRTGHHLTFRPRIDQGRWLAGTGLVRAMIDISDGFLLDANRLAVASNVSLSLDANRIPRRLPDTTLASALTEGEDYELLAAVSAADLDAVLSQWPFPDTPLTPVGNCRAGSPGVFTSDGIELMEPGRAGYDHLSRI